MEKMRSHQRLIFVLGGIFSGIGKGLITASIGKLFKDNQNKVLIQKNDSYLNIDPGFLNPTEHGEVFVTKDGVETDLDLGHYERFLNQDVTKHSLVTAGQIYANILTKERQGYFQGKTIDFYQVVNEIKKNYETFIANNPTNEVFLIELGGTVDNTNSATFLSAAKQLQRQYGNKQVAFIYLTYVTFLNNADEFKTKPAQRSIQELREYAIEPDLVVARSDRNVPPAIIAKLARTTFLDQNQIIMVPDQNIYFLPKYLKQHHMFARLCQRLALTDHQQPSDWNQIVNNFVKFKHTKPITIAIINKYPNFRQSYLSLFHALTIACNYHQIAFNYQEINPTTLNEDNYRQILAKFQGIVVPGGFGKRGSSGKILAIKYARLHQIPFLGICLGNQLALIEFARNVLNLQDADSREFTNNSANLIIDYYDLAHQTMLIGSHPIQIQANTKCAQIFANTTITERFRNRFAFNETYTQQLVQNGLIPAGINMADQRVVMWELVDHPFFVITQFHLEWNSRPLKPHPLFLTLIAKGLNRIKK